MIAVVMSAILAGFATQVAQAKVSGDDHASLRPTDTTTSSSSSSSDSNADVARAPIGHADSPPALVSDDTNRPTGAVLQPDERILGGPESPPSEQGHYEQDTEHSGGHDTHGMLVNGAAESDPVVTRASSCSSPPSSEVSAEGTSVVERDGAESPPQLEGQSQAPLYGAQDSGENGRHRELQSQATAPISTTSAFPQANDVGTRHEEDAYSASLAKGPVAASSHDVAQGAAGADVVQVEGVSPPAPSHDDAATPPHSDVLPMRDDASPSTAAWNEGKSLVSPLSEAQGVDKVRQKPATERHEVQRHWASAREDDGGEGATRVANDSAADEDVLSGTAGSSPKGGWLAEAEPTAKEHTASAGSATSAATAEASEGERSAESRADGDGPDIKEATSIATEPALSSTHPSNDDRSGHVPAFAEENGEAAAFSNSAESQAEYGDAVSLTGDNTTAASAEGFLKGNADDAARKGTSSSHQRDTHHEKLGQEVEQMTSSFPTSASSATPSSSSTSPPHDYQPHQLDSRFPHPSRLVLSYLYYHALEALYVEENVTLFVQRARDAVPYGHARLNWLLGVLHAYGVGVPRSERDALMYYSFAAMEAVPEAHIALGYRYKIGLGVEATCESALAHYREVADAVAMTYDGTAAAPGGGVATSMAGAETIGSGKGGRSRSMSFFAYRDDAAASDVRKQRRLDILGLKYQADSGSVKALVTLGYMFLTGDYQVARDGRRAAAYFKIAVDKGSARAHGGLGQLYMAGDPSISPPLLADLRLAHHHFHLGAAQNDSVSLNGMGFLHAIGYLHQDTRHRAKATVNGDTKEPDAKDEAVVPSLNGPPDFETAARYFKRSKCAEGLYNLGVLFLHGRGVVLDKTQAHRLFEAAAREGSVLAQWQLANMVSEAADNGRGISEVECQRALSLYQRTASFGSWQRRAASQRLSGTGVSNANARDPPHRQHNGQSDVDGDSDVRLWGEMKARHVSAHDSRGGEDDGIHDDGRAANHVHGFVRPRSEEEYQVRLAGILDRLHAVEDALVASDEGEGPTTVSLTSLVELLSLAEMGDASATWLAAKYVDNYLEVADTTQPNARPVGVSGAVPLFWPVTSAAASSSSSQYLSGEAATSELLYYLLQRSVMHYTHTAAVLGAAYLRLGNFYYYGESPLYGVDMERAMEYYRIAGDHYGNPQALFNVGFMYQLGLHKAPRVARIVAGMSAQEEAGRPDVLRPYTNVPVGAEWRVHSDPPEHLRASPAFYLAVKAAANAWNRASADPMARGVDVYLAWKYYRASLNQEARGSLAVRFALAVLNVQWSLRHFGVFRSLPKSVTSMLSSASLLPSAHSESPLPSTRAGDVDISSPTGTEDANRANQVEHEFFEELLSALITKLRVLWSYFMMNSMGAAETMLSWYSTLEDVMLYGCISVIVAGLLVRHHMT
ncbi:hypothetical protein JKF63_06424 [Porcisia hertigi]|uniref:Uncharacterized protein n=1 Tax=Porcisia hertigi TaxID=2761500 RepID=A0A836LK13_9TRYP|nr:hypothetical protein JKF63_06424 [Porcisia hertigi]